MKRNLIFGLASLALFAADTGSGSGGGMTINAALNDLDPAADFDWTEGGLPAMDRMKALTGRSDLTRKEVSDARPGFTRATADEDKSKDKPDPARKAGEGAGAKASSGSGTGAAVGGKTASGDDPKPGDLPIEDQGAGNPNDAANNAEERNPENPASGGLKGKPDDPEYHSQESADVTPSEIAERYPDAVLLLEAAVIAGGQGRYARNSSLSSLLRGYQVSQREIKEVQGRLDEREKKREEKREEGKDRELAEGQQVTIKGRVQTA